MQPKLRPHSEVILVWSAFGPSCGELKLLIMRTCYTRAHYTLIKLWHVTTKKQVCHICLLPLFFYPFMFVVEC